ncbi:MAG: type III pantothenate kinase [Chloroflexi bacterium]|nr:type III pantothenate kinase [Chloroflexota bacterium]
MSVLFALDIGNTAITIGIFDGEKLRATWNLATSVPRLVDEYALLLFSLLEQEGMKKTDVKEVVIGSVVPAMTTTFDEVFQRHFGVSPLFVQAGVKTGVKIRTDNPREVGADRIANTTAAHHFHGGPVIVVDFGTATVFDAVSKEGDYLGGAIAPGIMTAAEGLFTKAAQLYRVQLVAPRRAIGTNSIASMQSGIIFGYVGLVESMVARIQKELGEKAKVVATGGGYAPIIAKETKVFDVVDPSLTLQGLRLIYQLNRP